MSKTKLVRCKEKKKKKKPKKSKISVLQNYCIFRNIIKTGSCQKNLAPLLLYGTSGFYCNVNRQSEFFTSDQKAWRFLSLQVLVQMSRWNSRFFSPRNLNGFCINTSANTGQDREDCILWKNNWKEKFAFGAGFLLNFRRCR